MSTTRESDTATVDKKDAAHKNQKGRGVEKHDDGAGRKKIAGEAKPVDYSNPVWKQIIEGRRKELGADVLKITQPRGKLDPIVTKALADLPAELIKKSFLAAKGVLKTGKQEEIEAEVRAFIVKKGIASRVKAVTDLLNARRMTDGRRWALQSTYILLLAKLFQEWLFQDEEEDVLAEREAIEDLMKDDSGVVDKLMLDVVGENGPLDTLTRLVVAAVMQRNSIQKNDALRDLVSQQVRGAI